MQNTVHADTFLLYTAEAGTAAVARFEFTPSRKWISIFDLSWWQLVLQAWNSVTGERPWPSWAVTAQISRSCQSSFHSRAYVKIRPVSLGLYRHLSLLLTWPACLFVTSSTLTHSQSVCSSVCLSSSINLLSVRFSKTTLSPLIFNHPLRLLCLPLYPFCEVPWSRDLSTASSSAMLSSICHFWKADGVTANQPHPCAHHHYFLIQLPELWFSLSLTHSFS